MSQEEARPQNRLNEQQQALAEIAETLLKPIELEAMLQQTLDAIIANLGPAQMGVILLCDRSGDSLQLVAEYGYEPQNAHSIRRSAALDFSKLYFAQGPARFSTAPPSSEIFPQHRDGAACYLAAPISAIDTKYGVILLESDSGDLQFTEEDVSFIETIAKLIASAIERARVENLAAVHQARKIAEELHSERMSTLSHELRLPLTAIMGYASALLLDEIDWTRDKQAEFIGRIVEESENMQFMIKDLLDSALIEADHFSIQPQALHLQDCAREVAEEFAHRAKKHRIIVELPMRFPTVYADPHWIKQVLRNLLDNAIKYSPTGGLVVIRGEIRREQIVISVADQGIGIAPEDIPPLFEKYYRVKPPGGLRVPGTGLGLPIARTIVEAHGGRIWIESLRGQGTTVSFSLPVPNSSEVDEN